ncbi:hypothetical protein SAMN05216516_11313 [Izhakiella capsodis]|uniref:Lipoprotein n=1 Tax=Izhakiella capsodis TaxID=1367852 RepID=A0A1I5AT07_9GAMM|nr:hypothetical protein [Izhakiella capsodis]SFN65598.1 hypothetical protein SAMN05216516_11313 [Izhakiella capsodis]
MKSLWCLIMALLVSSSLAGCQSMFKNQSVNKTTQAPPIKMSTAPVANDTNNKKPESPQLSGPSKVDTVAENSTKSDNSVMANMERCKAQLDALKTLAPDKYPRLNNAFRYIMRGAASYASVRPEISKETQDTIDALYHYRSNLICAQISQTMMNTLSLHGAMP